MISGTIETQRFLVDYTFLIEEKWAKKNATNIQINSILSTGEFYETIKHSFDSLTELEKDIINLKIKIDASEQISKHSVPKGKARGQYNKF